MSFDRGTSSVFCLTFLQKTSKHIISTVLMSTRNIILCDLQHVSSLRGTKQSLCRRYTVLDDIFSCCINAFREKHVVGVKHTFGEREIRFNQLTV